MFFKIKINSPVSGILRFLFNLFRYFLLVPKLILFLKKSKKNQSNKKNLTIFAPIIETSHSVFFLTLILLKALELRGNKIIILICDQCLIACEIKNFYNKNDKLVCTKCKFNSNKIVKLFNFSTLYLSSFIDKEYYEILDKYANVQPDDIVNVDNRDVSQTIKDSIIRYYYGAFNNNKDEYKKIFKQNLNTLLLMNKISKDVDSKYNINIALGFMTAYTSWAPFFNYFSKNGDRFRHLSLNQFNLRSVTIDSHKLYPAKKRYKSFLKFRNYKELNQKEDIEINNFLNNRFSNNAEIFKKDNYFDINNKLTDHFNIDKTKRNIFLFSNIYWDVGVTDTGYLYNDVIEWIFKTIKFVENKNNINLYIKPHPGEIAEGTFSISGIEKILRNKIPIMPKNIFFIKPEWKIDTYSIFTYIDLALIYNGTLGLELIWNGINVVTTGKTTHHGLDFALEPTDEKKYFNLIINNEKSSIDQRKLKLFLYFYFIKVQYPWTLTSKVYGYSMSSGFKKKIF